MRGVQHVYAHGEGRPRWELAPRVPSRILYELVMEARPVGRPRAAVNDHQLSSYGFRTKSLAMLNSRTWLPQDAQSHVRANSILVDVP